MKKKYIYNKIKEIIPSYDNIDLIDMNDTSCHTQLLKQCIKY
jgi:hypothetical protein